VEHGLFVVGRHTGIKHSKPVRYNLDIVAKIIPFKKPTSKAKLCAQCDQARRLPLLHANPGHLVHPVTGAPNMFDIHGNAICPNCSARWKRERNDVRLTTSPWCNSACLQTCKRVFLGISMPAAIAPRSIMV
jgi:hypothetical protein